MILSSAVTSDISSSPLLLAPASSADAPARREFRVPTDRLPEVEAKIARLARRALKIDVPVPVLERLGVEYAELPKNEITGLARGKIELQVVAVSGDAPRISGWRFLARLERLPGAEGNLVHAMVAEEDLPEHLRTVRPACDHCKKKRARKDTFVVRRGADGLVQQVGSFCLADFLGHASPADLVAGCLALSDACGVCDEEERGWTSRHPDAWDLVDYLTWVHAAIRTGGWLSRGTAREGGGQPTADVAFGWMVSPRRDRRPEGEIPELVPDDERMARLAVAWGREIEATGDYQHNVRLLCRAGHTSARSTGLAASILPAYDRALAWEAERRARASRPQLSEHVGTVKERLRDLRLECVRVVELQSDWGPSHLHLFEDAEGRAYKWFSTSERLDVGATYNVDGTVKKHEEYKGRKSTVITRCDCATDEELARREIEVQRATEERARVKEEQRVAEKLALEDGARRISPLELRPGMRLAWPAVEVVGLQFWGDRYMGSTLEEARSPGYSGQNQIWSDDKQGYEPRLVTRVRALFEGHAPGFTRSVELKATKKVVAFDERKERASALASAKEVP